MAIDPNSMNGGDNNRAQAAVKVPSKDPKKKSEKEEDLSDEDLELKQQLELYVERVQDPDPALQKAALESMRQAIRTSTSSMTSVPKPLKFLRPHYGTLKAYFVTMNDSDMKKLLADILSVLALTMSADGELDSLKYRLMGSEDDIGSWGHEYVRNLAGEVAKEYLSRQVAFSQDIEDAPVDDLLSLVQEIVAFHMKHNAEPEAVDLLMEVEELFMLVDNVDRANFKRTCLYLSSASRYLLGPEDQTAMEYSYLLYLKFEDFSNALRIALFLDNKDFVKQIFTSCNDTLHKKQFAYMMARHGYSHEFDDDDAEDEKDRYALQDILNNIKFSEGYLTLARDIDVMEPKLPEDIYKAHLLDGRASAAATVDSARQNLAATFVNAFVNAGFGQDKLMTVLSDSSGSSWLFKNKEHGKTSAAASLGMILLWDVDSGLSQIDKYFHSNDSHVIAGALLGVGIVNCSIRNDCDPAMALLSDYLYRDDSSIRIGAIMGLGIAYAGCGMRNDELHQRLAPILKDMKAPLDVVAFTAISLGLIFVGSCNSAVADDITCALVSRIELQSQETQSQERQLHESLWRLMPLAVGLVYLGKQDTDDATTRISSLKEKTRKHFEINLLSCAYAGTGNVLKIQNLLSHCTDHLDKSEVYQGAAVLGIAMIAMAEELGLEMAIRSLEHVLQYGENNIRKAVPLALGLLCVSNPKVNVMDTLSRLSHDTDSEVAMAAVISLGLIGAGTNNARIAGMLRNLSSYYYKDSSHLFCVRVAQGLIHMGKGILSLNPYHSDRFLLSPIALAGLSVVLHACLDMKTLVLGRYHFILFFLVLAIQPRMFMALDENLKPISVPVRVGQAVDVVGQAGRPKTITGFQTHSTPVLLGAGDRAELATEKYIPLSSVLEGFVILKENPLFEGDH